MNKIYSTILTLFLLISCEVLTAQVLSLNTTNVGPNSVYPGQVDEMILRIDIEVGADTVLLSDVVFTLNGTTNPANDIVSAQLWQYNDSAQLNTNFGVLLGTYTNPGMVTNFTFLTPPTGNYTGFSSYNGLTPLKINFFWLAVTLSPSAMVCNYIDGTFEQLIADGIVMTPAISDPVGSRMIGICPTGTVEMESANNAAIYPVPSKNNISIDFTHNTADNVIIEVTDLAGKTIKQLLNGNPGTGDILLTYSLSDLTPGMYFIRLQNMGITTYNKIVLSNN